MKGKLESTLTWMKLKTQNNRNYRMLLTQHLEGNLCYSIPIKINRLQSMMSVSTITAGKRGTIKLKPRRKELIKTREANYKIENRKTIEKTI